MDRWGFIISHIGYTFLVDCPTPSKWKIRKHCGTTCHSLLTQWIWIWYGYGCVNVKPTPPTQWNSKQPWLRPLAPPHLLAATLLERPHTNQLPAFSRTILYFPNNCRCSQALSLRLRRPRSLGSVTAVQFSKSWGDPELGHDPAFTPRARARCRTTAHNLPFNRSDTTRGDRETSSPAGEDGFLVFGLPAHSFTGIVCVFCVLEFLDSAASFITLFYEEVSPEIWIHSKKQTWNCNAF